MSPEDVAASTSHAWRFAETWREQGDKSMAQAWMLIYFGRRTEDRERALAKQEKKS